MEDPVVKICDVCKNWYNSIEYPECEKCPVEIIKKDGYEYHNYKVGGCWVWKWSDEHKVLMLHGKLENGEIILLEGLIPS